MSEVEWDRRQLCADGACVGVIGADGTCKVCGRAAPDYDGVYRSGPTEPTEDFDDEDDDDDEADDDAGDDDEDVEASPDSERVERVSAQMSSALVDVDWEQRRVCPDGGCIGLIGADGTCSVCGRSGA